MGGFMKKYGYALGLLVTIFILTGCSSARIWTSTPAIQSADNQYFATQFEPIRIDADFINGFRLTVTNKSPQAIIIDWNATLYLLNNKNIGRFIFEGIDEKNVNDLPPDNIATGESLRKDIFPLKLIAWRQGPGFANLPAFSPGPVPEGQNGILLVVKSDGEQVREKINVTIKVVAK
jgi:hypothetical protein